MPMRNRCLTPTPTAIATSTTRIKIINGRIEERMWCSAFVGVAVLRQVDGVFLGPDQMRRAELLGGAPTGRAGGADRAGDREQHAVDRGEDQVGDAGERHQGDDDEPGE